MLRRLLRRFRHAEGGDPDQELRFWSEQWDAHIRDDVRRLVEPLRVERQRSIPEPHGHVGTQLVLVAVKETATETASTRLPAWISR